MKKLLLSSVIAVTLALPVSAHDNDSDTGAFVSGIVVGGIVGSVVGYEAGNQGAGTFGAAQRNEGFLDGYGAATGMTPGPYEVPAGGGGGGESILSPSIDFDIAD